MKTLITRSRRYRLIRKINRIRGLIAYYPLNEVEGNIARNYSHNNINNLTYQGSPVLGAVGKLGRSLTCDGVNDEATYLTANTFPITSHNAKSVIAIVNVVGATTLLGFGNGATLRTGLSMVAATNNLRLELNSGTGNSIRINSANNEMTLNNWAMVGFGMIECDATVARVVGDGDVYINGVNKTNNSANTGTASGTTSGFSAGAYSNTSTFMNGKIQHAAVFNRKLTDAEFRSIAHTAGFI